MIKSHYDNPPLWAVFEEDKVYFGERPVTGTIYWYDADREVIAMCDARYIDNILCYLHPITRRWHSVATGGVVV